MRFNYEDVFNMVMRLNLDRFIVGEIDIRNVAFFLCLGNIGYKGMFLIIYVNSV